MFISSGVTYADLAIDPVWGGLTIGDRKYKKGISNDFHSTKSDIRPSKDESRKEDASMSGVESVADAKSEESVLSGHPRGLPTKRKRA